MATINPIKADYDGQQLVFTAADVGLTDSFPFDRSYTLLVNNTSGSSRTATIPISGEVLGQTVSNRVVTCPTGQITMIRLGQQHVNISTGLIVVTWSSATGVGVALLSPAN